MAFVETQRMTYSGTNIDFAELRENIQVDDFDHIIHTDKSGGTITYTRNTQKTWTLDVICTEAEADTTFRSWMENRRTIVLTPKFTSDSGTTFNTQIMNGTFPFAPWGQGKWRGVVLLREE